MSSQDTTRKHDRSRRSLQVEAMESRQLLTGGAGNTLAILQGEVTEAGKPATLTFVVNPANFTLPKGRGTLGIDVAAPSGSKLAPQIVSVSENGGPARKNPLLKQGSVTGLGKAMTTTVNLNPASRRPGANSVTVLKSSQAGQVSTQVVKNNTPATVAPAGTTSPSTLTVQVNGQNSSTGKLLLGVYLPGDADGNGAVDQTDVKAIKARIGTIVGDANYAFDADSNRDGKIDLKDLRLAQQNIGVKSTIQPLVSANLDPASDTGATDRITAATEAKLTGTASAGATITYSEVNKKVPEVKTVADPSGNYEIKVPLAPGNNNFRVTAVDSSGQSISGVIDTINQNPVLAELGSQSKAPVSTTPAGTGTAKA